MLHGPGIVNTPWLATNFSDAFERGFHLGILGMGNLGSINRYAAEYTAYGDGPASVAYWAGWAAGLVIRQG